MDSSTPKSRLLVLHSAPVVLSSRADAEPTGAPADIGSDQETVRGLIHDGLWPLPASLTPDHLARAVNWQPFSRTLSSSNEALLLRLVLRARLRDGAFRTPLVDLRPGADPDQLSVADTLGDRGDQAPSSSPPFDAGAKARVSEAVSRLRAALPQRAGIRRFERDDEQGFVSLDVSLMRPDWFEVLAARVTADLVGSRDPYLRARALYSGEVAYARSLRSTPPRALRRAELDPPPHLTEMVNTRWQLRADYLESLAAIGHTERIILEYRLWGELLHNEELHRDRLSRQQSGTDESPRDCFFGLDVRRQDCHGNLVHPYRALGTMQVAVSTHAGTKQVQVSELAAVKRRPQQNKPSAGEVEGLRADVAVRRRVAETSGTVQRQPVSWPRVEALIRHLVDNLNSLLQTAENPARGQQAVREPASSEQAQPELLFQAVVCIARGGAMLATSLSEVMFCRPLGTVSISRYSFDSDGREAAAYVRGADLPLVRATRILVCDDVVASGVTLRKAIDEVIRPAYPDAVIYVTSLVADTQARHRAHAREHWLAGLETDLGHPQQQVWLDFCWKTLGNDPVSPTRLAADGGL